MDITSFLNTPKEFLLEMPLYEVIQLDNDALLEKVYKLLEYNGNVDVYCIWCKKESIFSVSPDAPPYLGNFKINDCQSTITLSCRRRSGHEYTVFYEKTERKFQKIGQYPSVADFQIPTAEKYRKILGEDSYKELVRGLGLYAHGVGIGSFVYLRRIFEKLIEEEHEKIRSEEGFDEEGYKKLRMDEKIEVLKKRLPSFLVKNKKIYTILSRGIHELTETDCLKYFNPIRLGVERILDEKIHIYEEEEKTKLAQKAIEKISAEIKS